MSDGLITRQELSQDLNEELNKTGTLTDLKTSEKANLVGSVNEVFDKTTLLFDKTTLLNDHLGTIEQILMSNLADFEDVQNKTGVLSNLVTSAKTTLVHAINETYNRITTLFNQLSTQIGTLSSLTTTNKTNLVSAVNEVNGKITNTKIRLNNGMIEYYDGGAWKSMGGNTIAIPSTTTTKILIGSTPITAKSYQTAVMARFISAYDGVIRIVGESTLNTNYLTKVAIFKVKNCDLDSNQYEVNYIEQSIPFGDGVDSWTSKIPSNLILVNKAEGGNSNTSYHPFNMLVPVEKGCVYLLTMNSGPTNTNYSYYLRNVFLQYTITSDDSIL